jgi:hypothetical protein
VSRIAYRTWVVSPGTGRLNPVAVAGEWRGAELKATCAAGGSGRRFHLPPNPKCSCGVYAWKRPVDPARIDQWATCRPEHVAVGVVRLWGRMCDGATMTGYRSQYARVVAVVGDDVGHLDLSRYPTVRSYPDLATMYSDWDVTPELGFAEDAATAAARARSVRRHAGSDRCIVCGERVVDDGGLKYAGRNPWAGGEPAPVALHLRTACLGLGGLRFDREWAYANRAAARVSAIVP